MQNKRGISQAFAGTAAGLEIRRATVFDAFAVSETLIASITHLCAADHDGDPEKMASWLANKSPQDVRGWIAGGALVYLALSGGAPAGVGQITPAGGISLLYMAPAAAGTGVGAALLAHLEAELRRLGCAEGFLTATKTALAFYEAKGWQQSGAPGGCFAVTGYPMRKLLQAAP